MKTPVKAKISLTPPATFRAEVEIRTPGGALAFIEFDFKHRKKEEIKELIASLGPPKGATEDEIEAFAAPGDVEVIMDIASGWDLDDTFNAKSIKEMTELYANSPQVIINTYLTELSGARTKN